MALTPLVSAAGLEVELTAALHIKLESLQRMGSFKDRGALGMKGHLDVEKD